MIPVTVVGTRSSQPGQGRSRHPLSAALLLRRQPHAVESLLSRPAPSLTIASGLVVHAARVGGRRYLVSVPGRRAARVGVGLLLALWALVVGVEVARAEVPPVIVGVREAVRDARRVLNDEHAPRHVGGMCEGGALLVEGDDMAERVEVERHLASCSRSSRRSDPWMVLSLVRLERSVGVPAGLLSSAVCWETGYTHGARGDWQDGTARAWGPMQMHGWWRAWCGWRPGARDDVEAAARCYLARVLHYLGDGECPGNWTRAEAMSANGPAYRPWGCAARSRHADELGRWGR